jgi:DNA-binding transcriptional MerR regulator
MKINQAAELAGITSKNIRFYEDQGLITPARDSGNGYRDYSMEDVEQLYRIKLLRMLGISCENIRRLQSGELDFDKCMDDHITELEKTGSNIEHMKTMCRVLRDEADSLSEVKASVYLERMEELEKGGAKFVNARMTDMRKRKTGAIISAIVMIAFVILVLGAMLYFNKTDPAPKGMIAFFIIMAAVIAVSIGYVLKQRIDEVKKGEIDEASKY